MADEAHRGQYGLTEKVVVKQKENGDLEAKTIIGTARIIRDSLSNATYIGFTGTPISSKDRSTREVFGDYIDIYDTTQTVEDGATRPVYYESRVIHLKLDENTLHLIDTEYDIMAQNADPYVIEKSKKELGQMEAILGADQTIDSLVSDILDHYENYRANILTGKAMIVAYSRPIAMKIYKRILELRPAWTEKVGVVMTQGNNDLEEWREIIGNKAHKDDLAKKFKDNSSPMKIAIVVDMWLTGFDVPSLATMYVYKPISDKVAVMYLGKIVEMGRTEQLFKSPQHPYTKALLESIPVADPIIEKQRMYQPLKGEATTQRRGAGCVFASRCPYASEQCFQEEPMIHEIEPGYSVACHLFRN